jgi:hypothetical protein
MIVDGYGFAVKSGVITYNTCAVRFVAAMPQGPIRPPKFSLLLNFSWDSP